MVPLAIYSEKVAHMFRGCKPEDMPPHIYAAAQGAYRGALASRRDQSLVFQGRSGAGKTCNFRHALHYLVLAAGSVNKVSWHCPITIVPTLCSLNLNIGHSVHLLSPIIQSCDFLLQVMTPEKLSSVWTLLEAFGNARTTINANATRFTQIFSLDLDQSGQIASASLQVQTKHKHADHRQTSKL